MERAPYSYRGDPAVPAFADDRPIFFFDGVCVLCTGFADFILRHDRAGVFRLAAAQSPVGQSLYRHYGLDPSESTTNLLLVGGRPVLKSEAFIETMARLPAPWPLFRLLRIAPAAFRDWVYDPIARHRLRLFGRRDACRLPTPEEAARFL